jgi:arylsulfatase A
MRRFFSPAVWLPLGAICCLLLSQVAPVRADEPSKAAQPAGGKTGLPNIVYILCDDLGYGDVRCFNPQGKIPTPAFDRIAREGMLFTDAHSGSAVCTPTRYGVITGRYAWRSKLQRGVLGGLSPRLIEPGRMTVASLLKQHGYHTACVGKWHLGMDWVRMPGKQVTELSIEPRDQVWNVDFAQPIANGPNAVGFDYYYGISASLDMVPYTFIENDRVTVLPTEDKAFAMNGSNARGTTRPGPTAPGFDVDQVLPRLTEKAVAYIASRAAHAREGQPFFLYLPLASPHTPIAPTKPWQGKSGLNLYADFVMETDWSIGQVLEALEQHGLAENTLVIATSDNGCSPQARMEELKEKGHNPSGIYRGHKADIYEGGHRVPFVVRWPAKIKPGQRCDQTVCLTDLMATAAQIVGAELPDNAGEDSVSLLPALLGETTQPLREATVHHSVNGSFAIRQGKWKLAFCPGSGGWSFPRPGRDSANELPALQLFDLEADPGEETNLYDKHPEVVRKLTALMEKYVAQGRSTPGEPQANAVKVNFRQGMQ